MAVGNFEACLAFTLLQEGGYSNDPHDPGGATMFGIIQREYDAWKDRQHLPRVNVRWISNADRDAIYKEQYWDAMKCDLLPKGVDLVVFDYGVNSGVVKSIRELQIAVNARPFDGHFGILTQRAVAGVNDRKALVLTLCTRRLSFLQALKNWKYFGRGWRNRVVALQAAALKMV